METMDVYQVARMFKVCRRTVINWAQRGVIPPGTKIGGVRRWPAEEIKAVIAQQKCNGVQPA